MSNWLFRFFDEFGGKLGVKFLENAVIEVLDKMIKFGCDINEPNYDGTPLWSDLLRERDVPYSLIDYLLANGAELPKESQEVPSLLFTALRNEVNWEIVRLLIKKGAEPTYVSEEDNDTALQIACCSYGYPLDLYKLLVEKGSPINLQKKSCGNSPLGNATLYDLSEEIINYLLEQGADVDALDCQGNTPLMRLLIDNMYTLERVKLLVERGSKLEVVNNDGYSVLGIAASNYWGDEDVVEYLIDELGLDPNRVENGETYLEMAVENENLDVAEVLVRGGFTNFDHQNEDGKTLFDTLSDEDSANLKELIKKWSTE